jgi:hypothetical protein
VEKNLLKGLIVVVAAVLGLLLGTMDAYSQVVAPPFNASYSLVNLGAVPGVPTNYGGLTFKTGDANTILIGGAANQSSGDIYSIGVTRGTGNHITGFTGPATVFSAGAYNDGGVVYGPGGVLFLARWPQNELGQTKPGSSITDKTVDLAALGVVANGPGGLMFVPTGFPGAGQLKLSDYPGGQFYTLAISSDGTGTYNVNSATLETTIVGGPEGIFYVPAGSPQFTGFNVLVCEYQAGKVAAYSVDAGGNPVPASRQDFITGLTGAEGAATDPLTGDFLFSTFGGGNQVIVVQGFAAPAQQQAVPASVPTMTEWGMMIFMVLAGLGSIYYMRRQRRTEN